MRSYKPRRHTIVYMTQGDCWVLAGKLSELTGWPVVAVIHPDDALGDPDQVGNEAPGGWEGWTHMAVQDPEGRILDINGPQSPEDFLRQWAWTVRRRGVSDEASLLRTLTAEEYTLEAALQREWWGASQFYPSQYSHRRVARRLLDTYYPNR